MGLFFKLVLAKKRFEILPLIESTFQSLSERRRGIHRAEYIGAAAIEPATEKKLIELLERKFSAERQISASVPSAQPATVKLITKVDKNLLGGFILKFDERVVDASYQTKLREIKQQLNAAAV